MRGDPDLFVAITPDDDTLLSGLQYLRVTGAGNLVLMSKNGDTSITVPAQAHEYVPFGGGYVMETTTATGILGFGYDAA